MPYSLAYMEKLRHPEVFRFCAIPQIMAAGTLALCFNNGKLFEGEGAEQCFEGKDAGRSVLF